MVKLFLLMKLKLATTLVAFGYLPCFSQNNPVGIFDNQQDIGYVKHAGSSTYDELTQSYTIIGSGANIWFNEDQFHFTYKRISGDFILDS